MPDQETETNAAQEATPRPPLTPDEPRPREPLYGRDEGRWTAPDHPGLHRRQPDYEHYQDDPLEIPDEIEERILGELEILYGTNAGSVWPELKRRMKVHHAHKTRELEAEERSFEPAERFTEQDALLITYGDMICAEGEAPLKTLTRMLEKHAASLSMVHVLPFFPYSSDRGFAVTDYEEVDPRLGTWDDIEALSLEFDLMFDGVINHCSSRCRWFQEFRNRDPRYENWFVDFTTRREIPPDHLEILMRPRTSPVLTEFWTLDGKRLVWTTFGPDQVDLDFRNPEVLLRMLDVLLLYVRKGARLLRLDAATYLWCELGTSCAHLEETHAIVRLYRAVLTCVAPRVGLVTETNVPHQDNVAYFGDGTDEAQMVYNFALPPLVLHTFLTGDSERLTSWAGEALSTPSNTTHFLNFLDSHDGIGLLGARDVLEPEEIEAMVETTEARGGLITRQLDQDGEERPYELNITWWSALNPETDDESRDLQVRRFLASRSIAQALAGVPAIYIASMIGTENDLESVSRGEGPRSINRRTISAPDLEELLQDPDHHAGAIFEGLNHMLDVRTRTPAFHPNGDQRILELGSAVFGVLRRSCDGGQTVLALTNVTAEPQEVEVGSVLAPAEGPADGDAAGSPRGETVWRDLLAGTDHAGHGGSLGLRLDPYRVVWLASEET